MEKEKNRGAITDSEKSLVKLKLTIKMITYDNKCRQLIFRLARCSGPFFAGEPKIPTVVMFTTASPLSNTNIVVR